MCHGRDGVDATAPTFSSSYSTGSLRATPGRSRLAPVVESHALLVRCVYIVSGSFLKTQIAQRIGIYRVQHSLPAPNDLSEAAQYTRARIRSCSTSFSIVMFSTLPTRYIHARVQPCG